jgi:hypothetical protein
MPRWEGWSDILAGVSVDTYKAFVSLVFTIEELSYITIRLTYSELLALSLISRIQEYIPGLFGLYIGNVILFTLNI